MDEYQFEELTRNQKNNSKILHILIKQIQFLNNKLNNNQQQQANTNIITDLNTTQKKNKFDLKPLKEDTNNKFKNQNQNINLNKQQQKQQEKQLTPPVVSTITPMFDQNKRNILITPQVTDEIEFTASIGVENLLDEIDMSKILDEEDSTFLNDD